MTTNVVLMCYFLNDLTESTIVTTAKTNAVIQRARKATIAANLMTIIFL